MPNPVLQAITTKYLSPGNVRGARIKATAAAGSLTVSYDHRLNTADNHRAAAEAFQAKMKWSGVLYQGCMANQDHCFVMVDLVQG